MGGLMAVAGDFKASLTAHHSPTIEAPDLQCPATSAIRAIDQHSYALEVRARASMLFWWLSADVERASRPGTRLAALISAQREEQVDKDGQRGN